MKYFVITVIAYTAYTGFQLAVKAAELIPQLTTMH